MWHFHSAQVYTILKYRCLSYYIIKVPLWPVTGTKVGSSCLAIPATLEVQPGLIWDPSDYANKTKRCKGMLRNNHVTDGQ